MNRLLPFLRASNAYDLERVRRIAVGADQKAYEICREHDFVSEEVFLLGRMGNNKQALMLIIERLDDVQKVTGRWDELTLGDRLCQRTSRRRSLGGFATVLGDAAWWVQVISMLMAGFIRALLEHVGSDINPIRLIRRIRDGMEVPGLKQALVKILQSANLQVLRSLTTKLMVDIPAGGMSEHTRERRQ